MLAVGPGVAESLVALLANVRFVSGVQSLVFRQVMLVFERLVADVTLKRSLS